MPYAQVFIECYSTFLNPEEKKKKKKDKNIKKNLYEYNCSIT